MTQVNPKCNHLSASSIGAFKACPNRYRLAYREGLRPARDTESQRVGTRWHGMHEAYGELIRTNQGGIMEAHAAALGYLNAAECPQWVEADAWALEREILYRSFIAYHWYFQNDPIEYLASEVPFNLPVHLPRTGLPLPMDEVQRVGKIDHLIRWQGGVGALERKSTSKSILPDSDYWEKGTKDTQVSMYALAFRDMRLSPPTFFAATSKAILNGESSRFGGTLYDVWHKPTIKPAMLTQAETKALIETGEYCGEKFVVEAPTHTGHADGDVTEVSVDGITATMTPGKKGFAIRETVGLYGARLSQDIYARPEHYFCRREIVRTEDELKAFRKELYAIYQAQKTYAKENIWFSNESQCRATFACPYIPICYGPGADSVCDGTTTPSGFRRIFVDLTVNGQEPEE